VFDREFGKERSWDIPLLEGYEYTFVENVSSSPGSHHFNGIINPTLIKELELWQPNAVLVIGWSFKSHFKAMRHFKGKLPVLFRGDSTLLDEADGFSVKKKIRRLFLTWVYRFIDIAFYVGKANLDYYIAHKVSKNNLVFAPHAIDNERFGKDADLMNLQAKIMRKQMGIKDDEVVILFAGKLIPKKSPDTLLVSFCSLNLNSAHLIIVGNGEMEENLRTTYQDNRFIHFLDFHNQSKMPIIYRVCDVFVLPSKGPGETWGLAVNEAMACKRAVIVSNKCGCAFDLVKQEVNGFIYDTNNNNELQLVLKKAIEKKEKLIEMGNQSLDIIKDCNFTSISKSIERVAKSI
jgi:glycosyltransferase involved in cell wall biosynthesis